jgi:hypothetical protein
MKVLLALTIILGGVLISKNSYADNTRQPSSVIGSDSLQVSGPAINPAFHAENLAAKACPLKTASAQKNGNSSLSTVSGKYSTK